MNWNSLDGLRQEQRLMSTEIFTDGTGEDRLLDVCWMMLGVWLKLDRGRTRGLLSFISSMRGP